MPVPLNECGRAQSRSLAEYLKAVPIDAIYSSPQSRALETAQIIGEVLQLKVREDERLAEISFGQFEGHRMSEVKALFPDAYRKWHNGYRQYRIPGGESRRDVQRRMRDAWDSIVGSDDGECVAIVTHGSATRIFLASMFATVPEKHQTNTSITILERDDEVWEIKAFAETPHLEK